MTQTEHDNKVLALASRGVDIMSNTVDLRRQSDPYARQLEIEYMFFRNVIDALADYDVDSDVLDDDDLDLLWELAESPLAASHAVGAAVTYTKTLFDDYYLPSLDELQAMHDNLHAGGLGGFTATDYWSSSEVNATTAKTLAFNIDAAGNALKTQTYNVRACRTFNSYTQYAVTDEGQAGGLIFSITDNLDGTYTNYEAAPTDVSAAKAWSDITAAEIGITAQGTAVGTGQANTTAIVGQSTATSAADLCNDLEITI